MPQKPCPECGNANLAAGSAGRNLIISGGGTIYGSGPLFLQNPMHSSGKK
jgi:hypothetical protein